MLQHALSKAIATNSVTITELARSAKLPLSVIRNWLQGTAPNARSRPSLCRVERELGLTHNSLVALTSLDVLSTEELGKSAQTISYRVGHAKRTKQKYRLTEFPAHFHIEWKNFLVYKTCLSPTLERQTKGIWRLRPIEDATLHYRRPQFMPNSAEYCPTASIAWSMVSSFLGFIKNHQTEIYLEDSQSTPKIPLSTNVQPTRISLALFTDVDLLSSYLEFMKVRAGTYTSGTLAVVQFALSLVHPQTGYLTQQAHFSEYVNVAEKDWTSYCQIQFERLKKIKRTLSSKAQISRNPFEPIASLTALDFPLGGYLDGIQKLRQYATKQTPKSSTWATAIRDAAMMALLAMHPVRAQNLNMMRFGPGGHLTQSPSGRWGMKFEPNEMKNHEGAAKGRPFDVALPEWVGELMNEWLFDARPILEDPSHRTSLVFISENKASHGIPWEGSQKAFARRVRRFIPHCPGFGPHSVRHLVATSWLKTHPHDYPSVALLLHDKLETVLKHYAHVEMRHTHQVHADEVERMYRDQIDYEARRLTKKV